MAGKQAGGMGSAGEAPTYGGMAGGQAYGGMAGGQTYGGMKRTGEAPTYGGMAGGQVYHGMMNDMSSNGGPAHYGKTFNPQTNWNMYNGFSGEVPVAGSGPQQFDEATTNRRNEYDSRMYMNSLSPEQQESFVNNPRFKEAVANLNPSYHPVRGIDPRAQVMRSQEGGYGR